MICQSHSKIFIFEPVSTISFKWQLERDVSFHLGLWYFIRCFTIRSWNQSIKKNLLGNWHTMYTKSHHGELPVYRWKGNNLLTLWILRNQLSQNSTYYSLPKPSYWLALANLPTGMPSGSWHLTLQRQKQNYLHLEGNCTTYNQFRSIKRKLHELHPM